MQVAVLLNGRDHDRITRSMTAAVQAAAPGARVTTYDPKVRQYPDPARYDLIVLSGGTADPMGQDDWVRALHDWLRATVTTYPAQKILGICWGHQTIAVAFGGEVAGMDRAELGVTTIPLTVPGHRFFGREALQMHEFHRREITRPAAGYRALADHHQSFLSDANTILTFQGHPELTDEVALTMLAEVPPYMGVEGERRALATRQMALPHDGPTVWRRIVEWVAE